MRTLYVSDLDGTLLNKQDRISEYSLRVLNQCIEDGLDFTYATARSLSSASVVAKGLRLKLPVIVYNGTFVINQDTGERVVSNSLTKRQREHVKEILNRFGIFPLVYTFIDGIEKVLWFQEKENEGMKRYLSLRAGDRRMTPLALKENLYEGEIFYFTCIGDKDSLVGAYEELKAHPDYNCTLQQELYREEYWFEIMPRKSTKADAILKIKELYGFNKVVSFGDAVNDIPMFRISDECYAVENAVDALKEIAVRTVLSNEEDGVARHILSKLS